MKDYHYDTLVTYKDGRTAEMPTAAETIEQWSTMAKKMLENGDFTAVQPIKCVKQYLNIEIRKGR